MSAALFDDDKIKLMLRRAETEPLAFAFALGEEPEQHVLVLSPTLKPKALLGQIGKEKDVGKGTFGQARVAGKELILDCEKKLPGLAKHARMMLKARGFKQTKVRVLVNGQEIVEEGDTEGASPAPATTPAPAPAPAGASAPAAPLDTKALATAAAAWKKAVGLAETEIKKLRVSIVSQFKSMPNARELAQSTKGLDDAMEGLTGSAWDSALDNAVNNPTPEALAELKKQAARMVKLIEKNGILDMIDNNPFTTVKAKKTLLSTLEVIQGKLTG